MSLFSVSVLGFGKTLLATLTSISILGREIVISQIWFDFRGIGMIHGC